MKTLTKLFADELVKTPAGRDLLTTPSTTKAQANKNTVKFRMDTSDESRLKCQIDVDLRRDLGMKIKPTPGPSKGLAMPMGVLRLPDKPDEKVKPVLQLNRLPFPIDLEDYWDAWSPDHPGGSYLATYRFRNLANPIPTFTQDYQKSNFDVEQVWKNIINGAEPTTNFVSYLLAEAKNSYERNKLTEISNIANTWLPIHARPANWYELVFRKVNLETLKIALTDPEELATNFSFINGKAGLKWLLRSEDGVEEEELGADTKLKEIELKILRVDFLRSWLDPTLLNLGDWKINGMPKGFFSSGSKFGNTGVFPLLTTSMIVGTEAKVTGDWNFRDEATISRNANEKKTFSLGPFVLGTKDSTPQMRRNTGGDVVIESKVAHIVGFISDVVARAPAEE